MTLADDINTDLDTVFFKDATEFNVLAVFTLTHSGGGKLSIYGLFSNEYLELEGVGGLSSDSSIVEFMVKSTAVDQVRRGDSGYIDLVSYAVTSIRQDGLGLTALFLEKKDVS